MSGIARDEAVERLIKGIEGLPTGDLIEVYNDLFPRKQIRFEEFNGNSAWLMGAIMNHVHRGLELDEISGLWNVVFSGVRSMYWNEVDERFYPNPEWESVYDDE